MTTIFIFVLILLLHHCAIQYQAMCTACAYLFLQNFTADVRCLNACEQCMQIHLPKHHQNILLFSTARYILIYALRGHKYFMYKSGFTARKHLASTVMPFLLNSLVTKRLRSIDIALAMQNSSHQRSFGIYKTQSIFRIFISLKS